MREKFEMVVGIYAAVLSTVAVGWIVWTQTGKNAITFEKATIRSLSTEKVLVRDGSQELAFVGKSRVSGGGALALMNSKGTQSALLSDGAFALRGVDSDTEAKLLSNLRDFSLILGATEDSATVAMKGDTGYEVVMESGKTADDPLGIRGGRINLCAKERSVKVDSSGVQEAPKRNW